MDILAMLRICITTVSSAILSPPGNLGFVLFVFIIYLQYKKTVRFQEIVYGKPKISLKNLVLSSVLAGTISGIVVSIPMTLVGVSFNQDMGLELLILLSLLFMLIEPRFICFAYSGGILSIISLVFGISRIDVTGILILVGLLHLIESLLIYFDGFRGAVPVFLEQDNGSILGGFTMNRFWPIPIALLLFAGYGGVTGDVVPTPDWWPVIRPHIEPGRIQEALFTAVPVAAILGYSDFTSSYIPRDKCRRWAFKLVVFSLILLLLAGLSQYIYIFKYIAALFAPIAHEAFIEGEKRLEKRREPLFAPSDKGLKVLDTVPDGAGEAMGIMPGETILSINNREVLNESTLDDFFRSYITYIWVDIKDRQGNVRSAEYKNYKEGIDGLDIIFVPVNKEGLITVKERKSFIKKVVGRFNK